MCLREIAEQVPDVTNAPMYLWQAQACPGSPGLVSPLPSASISSAARIFAARETVSTARTCLQQRLSVWQSPDTPQPAPQNMEEIITGEVISNGTFTTTDPQCDVDIRMGDGAAARAPVTVGDALRRRQRAATTGGGDGALAAALVFVPLQLLPSGRGRVRCGCRKS